MSGLGDGLAELKEPPWLEARKAEFKPSFRRSPVLWPWTSLSLSFSIFELGMHYLSPGVAGKFETVHTVTRYIHRAKVNPVAPYKVRACCVTTRNTHGTPLLVNLDWVSLLSSTFWERKTETRLTWSPWH